MEKNQLDGLSLVGMAVGFTGMFPTSVGWGKWALVFSAFVLATLGLCEIFCKGKKAQKK